MKRSVIAAVVLAAGLSMLLPGCGGGLPPHLRPLSKETKALLAKKGMREDAPIFVRVFKEENELEVWKVKDDGRFHHFKTYPICAWSGKLGPKLKTGDKQAPEGFYKVTEKQMNPNSSYHLSFNLGFPNAFDKAHRRTGKYLMVHGDCKSAGCYAMTDALIEEIYALAREAFKGGQESFDVHAYPYRMTPENMKRHRKNKWYAYWRNLQQGYDHFEYTHLPPKVEVCERRYLVNVAFVDSRSDVQPDGPCPPHETLPVEAFPPPPQIQEAGHPAPSGTATGSTPPRTAASQPANGGGSTFGFAPATPSLSGFAFRSNAVLSR